MYIHAWSIRTYIYFIFHIKARGVDVNEVESIANGVTVLMCCCYLGREDAVKLLVKKGADLSLADVNGWNSLHYAVWGQVGIHVHVCSYTCTTIHNHKYNVHLCIHTI